MLFFSQLDESWGQYHSLRQDYANGIPIPQYKYIKPLSDIDDFARTIIRPIEKPLWFALHTLGFLVKCVCSLIATCLLAICALFMSIVSPKSILTENTNASFKLMLANTLVSFGMAALALLSFCFSPVLNTIFAFSRGCATVLDHLNSTTESCCGISIAKL